MANIKTPNTSAVYFVIVVILLLVFGGLILLVDDTKISILEEKFSEITEPNIFVVTVIKNDIKGLNSDLSVYRIVRSNNQQIGSSKMWFVDKKGKFKVGSVIELQLKKMKP